MIINASIRPTSLRAANWLKVFGRLDGIPLLSEVRVLADLPGKPSVWVYMLDVAKLTDEERLRLVDHIAATFNFSAEEVARDLYTVGVPMLAEDVVVTVQASLFEQWAGDYVAPSLFDDDAAAPHPGQWRRD